MTIPALLSAGNLDAVKARLARFCGINPRTIRVQTGLCAFTEERRYPNFLAGWDGEKCDDKRVDGHLRQQLERAIYECEGVMEVRTSLCDDGWFVTIVMEDAEVDCGTCQSSVILALALAAEAAGLLEGGEDGTSEG